MRPAFLLVALALLACGDPAAPSTGTLRVATATTGDDPDQDGYLLSVDEADPVSLDPNGISDLELAPGRHTLSLLGVAAQCSVVSPNPLGVEVPSHTTTIVTIEITCPLTGARITVATTGLDLDSNGYRLEVDGTDRGRLPGNGTLVTRLESGERTFTLTDVAPNCAVDGQSREVTVVHEETATVAFAVVCVATTGVIRMLVDASGTDLDGSYRAVLDGRSARASYREPTYLHVGPGTHVVSLVPPSNCSVSTPPQEVTVTAGGLVRDTVEVRFSVTCEDAFGYVRVTVSTSGTPRSSSYVVWMCDWADSYYCHYSTHTRLGNVDPNDTLISAVEGGVHRAWLENISDCGGTTAYNPSAPFTVTDGDTVSVSLRARC